MSELTYEDNTITAALADAAKEEAFYTKVATFPVGEVSFTMTNASFYPDLFGNTCLRSAAASGAKRKHDKTIPEVDRILFYNNNKTTVVFWKDGTKTTCVCDETDEPSKYAGFVTCLAKKIYGTTSKIKRVIEQHDEIEKREQEKLKQKEQKEKEHAEHEKKKAAAHRNAVRRKLEEMRIEQEAASRLTPSLLIEDHSMEVCENV